MIHEPNLTHWKKGDVVLHDADAKEPGMLMVVIGFALDGLVKTQYVDKRRTRKVWKNEMKYLLDPDRFGINPKWLNGTQNRLEYIQGEWAKCKRFNRIYRPGADMLLSTGEIDYTVLEAHPNMDKGFAEVTLKKSGAVMLASVKPLYSEKDLEKLRR